jgi:hypothetical protein
MCKVSKEIKIRQAREAAAAAKVARQHKKAAKRVTQDNGGDEEEEAQAVAEGHELEQEQGECTKDEAEKDEGGDDAGDEAKEDEQDEDPDNDDSDEDTDNDESDEDTDNDDSDEGQYAERSTAPRQKLPSTSKIAMQKKVQGAATCEEALQYLRDLARNPLPVTQSPLRQAILGFHSNVYQHRTAQVQAQLEHSANAKRARVKRTSNRGVESRWGPDFQAVVPPEPLSEKERVFARARTRGLYISAARKLRDGRGVRWIPSPHRASCSAHAARANPNNENCTGLAQIARLGPTI